MPTENQAALRVRILALEQRLAELQPADAEVELYYKDMAPGRWRMSTLEAAYRTAAELLTDDDEREGELRALKLGWVEVNPPELRLRLCEYGQLVQRRGSDAWEIGFDLDLSAYAARELRKRKPDAPEEE